MNLRARFAMLRENALMAVEKLLANKTRSFLTMLGVFIGVVIVTSVAAVLNGFRDTVVRQVESFGTNNVYIYRFPFIRTSRPDAGVRKRRPLSLEDAWSIRDRCPSVRYVAPGLELPPWVTTARAGGETMEGAILRGGFPESEKLLNATLREGRFFTDAENRHRVAVAVIGHEVAVALFPARRAVGETLEVSGNRYRIIGVLEKAKEGPFGAVNREDLVIHIPYGTFHKQHPGADDHFIAAQAYPGRLSEAVEEITAELRRRRKVPWNAENDFEIGTASSIVATFDEIVFGVVAVMFILSSVAFMVGGVGVMNILLASVKERTSEIGMRKAIGARRRDIAWQFLVEAMVLTGVGGILGLLASDILAAIVERSVEGLALVIPLWARLAGFGGSVAVGLVFGMWPALKAAALDPIEALHYE